MAINLEDDIFPFLQAIENAIDARSDITRKGPISEKGAPGYEHSARVEIDAFSFTIKCKIKIDSARYSKFHDIWISGETLPEATENFVKTISHSTFVGIFLR